MIPRPVLIKPDGLRGANPLLPANSGKATVMSIVLAQENYENLRGILTAIANVKAINKSKKPNTLSLAQLRQLGSNGLKLLDADGE